MGEDMLEKANRDLFLAVNALAHQVGWVDGIAVITAKYLPLLFVGVLVYLWFTPKYDGKAYALYAGYATVIGLSINALITLFYFHPRPFMDGVGITLIQHVPETSFPSDHTTLMLSIAMVLFSLRVTRTLGSALLVLGVVGGLSRVFSGVHYPFDILGSVVVSFVAALFVLSFRKKLDFINKRIINTYFVIANKIKLRR